MRKGLPPNDMGVDIDPSLFTLDLSVAGSMESRYVKPYYVPELREEYLKYENAEALAAALQITPGSRHYVIVDGSFYFGDFIEALFVSKDYGTPELIVATLSLNENNVDSLANLLDGGYAQKLTLVVSAYFYGHERSNLVEYMYEELDKGDRFQLVVAGTHCKLCLFETDTGLKIVMHGSANLRSSSNMEQLMIEENADLYAFNKDFLDGIKSRYATIDHSIRRMRGKQLWQAVAKDDAAEAEDAEG